MITYSSGKSTAGPAYLFIGRKFGAPMCVYPRHKYFIKSNKQTLEQ